jgi:hypothetical protein
VALDCTSDDPHLPHHVVISLIIGFVKSKLAVDGVIGTSLVLSTTLAVFVGWKVLDVKRANIAISVMQSGGAVIVGKDGKVIDLDEPQPPRRRRRRSQK